MMPYLTPINIGVTYGRMGFELISDTLVGALNFTVSFKS